jgi:methylenetetrahydrofolate reductase (NADPH)
MVTAAQTYRARLLQNMTYEVVPMKSVEKAMTDLPPGSKVSVTCSPVKGIDATMKLCERIRSAGHDPVPHVAARLVESEQHTNRIAQWLRTEAFTTAYIIGGDAPTPAGPYADALTFLRSLLDADPGVDTIGVGSYPDGHALITNPVLREALHAKQQVLAEAGIDGYASTQMCFAPATIIKWLDAERADGLTLPVMLGIPGVINQAKLLTMGVRLGIGASLRYLRKNRNSVSRMLAPGGFDPNQLLIPLEPHFERLGITGLHCFTFNQVAATKVWAEASVEDLSSV